MRADRDAFTSKVRYLNQHMTLAEMEEACHGVRKASWWGRVARYDETIQPPFYNDEIAGIALLFKTSSEQVRRMIAEEWLGVATPRVSDRVKLVAPQVDTLTEEDFQLVEGLVNRLAPKQSSDDEWRPKTAK
ncbi:hypothetical protein [Streptomyces sp. NPDC001978]|uniref:hypothetical protein n=1 Tax=Streptomyces sp. NPDC001978 TaxID=3364627 RepID=UPI0036806E20